MGHLVAKRIKKLMGFGFTRIIPNAITQNVEFILEYSKFTWSYCTIIKDHLNLGVL